MGVVPITVVPRERPEFVIDPATRSETVLVEGGGE